MSYSGIIRRFGLLFLCLSLSATAFAGERGTGAVLARNGVASWEVNKNIPISPIVNEKYVYYDVCGLCANDIQCDLKKKCIKWTDGEKYDSVTSWKIKWDYGRNRVAGACSAEAFTVTVDIVFRPPRWERTIDAPRALADKWDTYMKNLVTHENGHRDLAVAAATYLTRDVAELAPAQTCDELDRRIDDLSRIQMEKLDEAQKEYDVKTDHGRKQGAVFP